MVSNLSSIGFVFDDNDAFSAAMIRLANDAVERLSCAAGEYAIWRSRTGAEIWFHLAPAEAEGERQIVGLTPFFEGQSSVPLKITHAYQRPEDNPLEGAFHAWARPDSVDYDSDSEGSYPLVFDAVDFAAHATRDLPEMWTVRVAAFARELKAYPDAESYLADEERKPRLSDHAFIPMGLFALAASESSEDRLEAPSSTAILTGKVVEHVRHENEETGQPFHWLLIESLDATYDCVADPQAVTGDIVVGGTVEVAAMLFGRTLD